MRRRKGERYRKSQALQPKKTLKFKQRKMLHQEDQRTPYPQPPSPPSQPLVGSDLMTENPCLDIVLAADDTGGLKPEAFVGTVSISSLPPCPMTPSHLSIVPYEEPLSSRTSIWKTMNQTLSNHRNRKKLATLSNHFNPIPFLRERPSDFATHQLLLTRLGLWNFLHLDFDRNIHSDLIKQLVVYYNPKKPAHRRSHVNGWPILVSRAALARALALPTKRLNLVGNDAARDGPFMASEEESVFVEELVSSWLVLQDDSCELPGEVLKVKSLIRERRLEDVDWARLIWFMVKSELLKGDKLVNCYYASHMQLLLKNQKLRLFGDHVETAGFLDIGAAVGDEVNLDNNLSGLDGPEIVNRCIGLFSEESEKERILDAEENAVGVEESGREQKAKTTLERYYKWRNSSLVQWMQGSTLYGITDTNCLIAVDNCKGNKLHEPLTTVTPSPGDFEVELNNATCEVQDHNVVEKVSGEKCCAPDQQSAIQKEDGNNELKLLGGEDETKLSTEGLFVGNSGELPDSLEKKVGSIAEKSIMDGENQHTEIAMEEEKPELLGIHDSLGEGEEIVKPETSGLNEILGPEMDLQNKNAMKIEPFVEPFALQAETYMNLAGSPLDNSLKREIDCLNDSQFERLNETQKITGFNSAAGESFDLDLCSEQAELWVSRLKNAALKCAQMDNGINAMLLKELETKNQIIEQSEKIRRQEQHKYQKDIQRYERELYLMKNILDEYRTALDQVHKSFAEYRKRTQLPEEPIYVDHPDGGGKVVLATELESSKLKQGRENL